MKKEKGTEAKFLLLARRAPGNIPGSGKCFNRNRSVSEPRKGTVPQRKKKWGGLIGHFHLLVVFSSDYWNKVTTSQDVKGILGLEYINRADVTADTTCIWSYPHTYICIYSIEQKEQASSFLSPLQEKPADDVTLQLTGKKHYLQSFTLSAMSVGAVASNVDQNISIKLRMLSVTSSSFLLPYLYFLLKKHFAFLCQIPSLLQPSPLPRPFWRSVSYGAPLSTRLRCPHSKGVALLLFEPLDVLSLTKPAHQYYVHCGHRNTLYL